MTALIVKDEDNLPVSLAEVDNITKAQQYRMQVYREKTPSSYIRIKDKFPYLPSKYVDDTFKKWFPVYSKKVVDRKEDDYWITYTVEITVFFPHGVTMTEIGTGGARKQVTTDAKKRVTEGRGNITPFDYVDNGNASKAALTLAIKNAQERFGIGADITERIIMSPEEIEETNKALADGIETITNPRDKIKWKEKLAQCDTPGKKLALLEELRELFDVEAIVINQKQ